MELIPAKQAVCEPDKEPENPIGNWARLVDKDIAELRARLRVVENNYWAKSLIGRDMDKLAGRLERVEDKLSKRRL